MKRVSELLSPARVGILGAQVSLAAAFILCWQYLPSVGFLRHQVHFLDPYFISSPSRVYREVIRLAAGHSAGTPRVWSYLWFTLEGTLIGTAIGLVTGAAAGLWLSSSPTMNRILRPFIILANSLPRIALIPVFVLMFGATLQTSVVVAIAVVFFIVFFNAYEGGSTVPPQIIQNAKLLGATGFQQMVHFRLRYVTAWSFAALPNAVSFGLIAVVTAELLTGTRGMGRLLLTSISILDATLTFAVVVILGVAGVILVGSTELLKRRWLHWWLAGEGATGGA